MKIIFDSEEEKELFIEHCCPDKVKKSLDLYCYEKCDSVSCKPCWENCGIDLEIEEIEHEPESKQVKLCGNCGWFMRVEHSSPCKDCLNFSNWLRKF